MMKKMLVSLAFFPAAIGLMQAQNITGDWQGTLSAPSGQLRIALHITKADGGLKATLDSVDQAVTGVPVASIKQTDSKVTFNLTAPPLSFEGKVDEEGKSIDGMFGGEGGSVPFTLTRGTIKIAKAEHKPAKPSDIDGDWTGSLEGQNYLFHIRNTEDGLIVAMDLPSQYIKGAEANSVTRNDSSIAMEWKAFGSKFEGKIADDRGAIEGNVTQAGQSIPFTLKRAKP